MQGRVGQVGGGKAAALRRKQQGKCGQKGLPALRQQAGRFKASKQAESCKERCKHVVHERGWRDQCL